MVEKQFLVDQSEFEQLCQDIRDAGIVAFDTEFVSEETYFPQLCLLQFGLPGRSVIVDPFEVTDLSEWWQIMTDDTTTVVVHGGREEIRFCHTETGHAPRNLVDVQIAEGLRSRGYPLGYANLVSRVLGERIYGKETRTDWRRRPLSQRQMDYAYEDVRHLLRVWESQQRSLAARGRAEWVDAEIQRIIDETCDDRSEDRWRRISGIHRLNLRELAVARELFRWREKEARNHNQPVRRVLRDDLLLELSRRQPQTVEELLASRDMNRRKHRQAATEMLAAIHAGKTLPDDQLPRQPDKRQSDHRFDDQILAQLLRLALSNRCADLGLSVSLVATSADLRNLVRWYLGNDKSEPTPRLREGWRASVCGNLLTDLLDGRVTIRVVNPHDDNPLAFEQAADDPETTTDGAAEA